MPSDQKTYARLDNGVVVEYPVFLVHITNRAHPLDWYNEVIYDPAPEAPEFFYQAERLEVIPKLNGRYEVRVRYEVKPQTLAWLLSTLRKPDTGIPGDINSGPPVPVDISEVSEAKIARIAFLSSDVAQQRLDEFARTKNYDDIKSTVTYKDSSIPKFAAEANRAIDLRDQTWASLYTYLEKVRTGEKPVPLTVAEIVDNLPELVW